MAKLEKWLPVLIGVCAVLAYSNSFHLPFILDDSVTVTKNPNINSLLPITLTPRGLADLTFRINYVLGGFNVVGYHVVNLAIHIACGLLIFGIVGRTLMLPRLSFGSKTSVRFASVTAALWLLHPLQTASVTYISQRLEAMMSMFLLMSLYSFLRSATHPNRSRWWGNLAVVASALGMATKEVMVVAPLLILAYDYVFMAESFRDMLKRRWRIHVALASTWGILAMLMLNVVSASMEAGVYIVSKTPMPTYLMTQPGVIMRYLRLSILPNDLCLDYAWPLTREISDAVIPAVVVIILFGGSFIALVKQMPISYVGIWFFIILAPTSSILPLDDAIFEHRMYLPLLSVVIITVFGATWFVRKTRLNSYRWGPITVCAFAFAMVVVLGVMTFVRNNVYRSEETVWNDVVSKRPNNLRARNDLAVALSENGKYDEALTHYAYVLKKTEGKVAEHTDSLNLTETVSNNSHVYNRFRALANMGLLHFQHGDTDAAIDAYVRALKIFPHADNVVMKLRTALLAAGMTEMDVNREIGSRVFGNRE